MKYSPAEYEFEKRKSKLYAKFSEEFIKLIRTDSDAMYVVAALLNDADPLVLLEKLLLERMQHKEKTKQLIQEIITQSTLRPIYWSKEIYLQQVEQYNNNKMGIHADSRPLAIVELLDFIIAQNMPDVSTYPDLVPMVREKFDIYKRGERFTPVTDAVEPLITDIIDWENGNKDSSLEKLIDSRYNIYKK